MRILVTGGAGMLGHKVVQRLMAGDDVWWTLRPSAGNRDSDSADFLRGENAIIVDAARLDDMSGVVCDLRPDVIVNCVGVIKQSTSADAETAGTINARLPHRLAEAMQGWGGRLIQISTDCVFSGLRGAYTEDDAPDAIDVYGRSKAAGEVVGDGALTLRTSLIGRELRRHRSLLDWLLSRAGTRIGGFRRAIWSGVTTLHLAQVIDHLIHDHPGLSGLYHISSGRTSKYDLLVELKNRYHLDVEIDPVDSVVCDRSLVGSRFERVTGYRCPPLSALIDEMLADPTPYPSLP